MSSTQNLFLLTLSVLQQNVISHISWLFTKCKYNSAILYQELLQSTCLSEYSKTGGKAILEGCKEREVSSITKSMHRPATQRSHLDSILEHQPSMLYLIITPYDFSRLHARAMISQITF